jgi:DNA-binding CsgD family transcriptional regulator
MGRLFMPVAFLLLAAQAVLLEILRLLANGQSNTDIAAQLFLSEGTVRNYVSGLFAKLGVTDRTQAAVSALRHGLADCKSGSELPRSFFMSPRGSDPARSKGLALHGRDASLCVA